MDFHKQKISIIITSFTSSLVDTIPLIVDQRLHSVLELPAKAVNIMVLLSGRITSESPGGSLTRIVYQLGHYSTRSTRINSDFGIVSDDLDGTTAAFLATASKGILPYPGLPWSSYWHVGCCGDVWAGKF